MPKKKSMEDRIAALEAKINGKLTTRILVIQDRSGSMIDRVSETITGYNEYVGSLADDDSDIAYLTLVQFDDRYEVKEESTPVANVKTLSTDTFVPRGMTALLDAVGKGITEFEKTIGEDDRAFVVIMTDGGENASREYTSSTIGSLIRRLEDKGNWTFTFLGAGHDSWGGAKQLGLRRNQAAFYGESAHAHSAAFAGITDTTRSYRGGMQGQMVNTGATVSNLMAEDGAEVELEDTSSESNLAPKTKASATSGSEN